MPFVEKKQDRENIRWKSSYNEKTMKTCPVQKKYGDVLLAYEIPSSNTNLFRRYKINKLWYKSCVHCLTLFTADFFSNLANEFVFELKI